MTSNLRYEKKCPISYHHNDKRLIVFLLKSGTRQGYPLLPLQLSLILEVLTSTIREEKEIKGRQIGKAGVIVFIENPCNPQKLLELSLAVS